MKNTSMTKEQIHKKYAGKYIEFSQIYDYENNRWRYDVHNVYKEIHENTTLGEDVGTELEYKR